MAFVSFAQNREDVLLHRVFGGQETGFYVDVGAYHPVLGSVTKAFYDRGWSGINVEPGVIFDELAAARPRDVNLRMVVLDRVGTALLRDDPADPGMTRVVGDHEAEGAREVPCDTLEAIVRRHSNARPLDFLKVDAEGAEAAIVASTDWRRFRPRVLVFEATLPWSNVLSNDAWEPMLLAGGYTRVFFDGINCFYVPEEELAVLERHFRVPVNVLDDVRNAQPAPEPAEAARAEAEAARVKADAARTAAEAARDLAKAEGRAAEAQLRLLQANLAAAQAERARLQGAHAAELERLGERHAAALEGVHAERSAAEQKLQAALVATEAERTQLAGLHAELVHHTAAVRATQEQLAAELRVFQGAGPAVAPPPSPLRRFHLARRLARSAYLTVRPVVRPALHRLRTFMTTPQLQSLESLREEVQLARAAVALTQATPPPLPPPLPPPPPPPPQIQVVTAPADLAELRRLAAEIERAVLTLAMEASAAPDWRMPELAPLAAPSFANAVARTPVA